MLGPCLIIVVAAFVVILGGSNTDAEALYYDADFKPLYDDSSVTDAEDTQGTVIHSYQSEGSDELSETNPTNGANEVVQTSDVPVSPSGDPRSAAMDIYNSSEV